jgi:hypothetical protein
VQRRQPLAQRSLQRAQIEHHAGRFAPRQLPQNLVRDPERRGHDDEVVCQVAVAPVRNCRHRPGGAGGAGGTRDVPFGGPGCGGRRRVGDLHLEALRGQKLHEPAAHLARATDHQRAPPAARAVGSNAGALLRRQRGADQQPHDRLGGVRGNAELFGRRARPHDHLALAPIVAGRIAGRALHARDLAAGGLSLGNDLQQLPVQPIELAAQFIQGHGSVLSGPGGRCRAI